MSYEIFYDRAFVLVGEDSFVPMVNQGSNNSWEPGVNGRDLPEKTWQVLNYKNRGKLVYTKSEIREIAKDFERISQEDGTCYKSRYRQFAPGEFERWINNGMKNAFTIEEYIEYGNTPYILDYTGEVVRNWERHFFDTTEKFLQLLEQIGADRNLNMGFLNQRAVSRPFRPREKRQNVDYRTLEFYYVLQYQSGYFYKWTKRGFLYTAYADSASSRKFKTEKDAQRYLDKYKGRFGKIEPSIKRIAGNTAAE